MPILYLDPSKLSPPAESFRERFDRLLLVDGDNHISPAEWTKLQGHPDYPRIRPAITIDGVPQGQIGVTDAILAFVNRARRYQLEAVPTIGRVTAQAIVDNRPVDGYSTLSELTDVLPTATSLDALRGWATWARDES